MIDTQGPVWMPFCFVWDYSRIWYPTTFKGRRCACMEATLMARWGAQGDVTPDAPRYGGSLGHQMIR